MCIRDRVQRDRDVFAGPIAGLLDRPEDHLDCRLVRWERRGEAALVALTDRKAAVVEDLFEGVENLRAGPEGFGEGRSADRRDHELLEVGGVHGVLATVEDVEERDRHDPRAGTTDVAIERQVVRRGGRVGCLLYTSPSPRDRT